MPKFEILFVGFLRSLMSFLKSVESLKQLPGVEGHTFDLSLTCSHLLPVKKMVTQNSLRANLLN